mmetsp:Transcript_2355/g.7491  ORF Transcript_2355/g.7491 Transcript_2355/m.7491 type:complete len:221 (+) Transcript_2355:1760-2422(+)
MLRSRSSLVSTSSPNSRSGIRSSRGTEAMGALWPGKRNMVPPASVRPTASVMPEPKIMAMLDDTPSSHALYESSAKKLPVSMRERGVTSQQMSSEDGHWLDAVMPASVGTRPVEAAAQNMRGMHMPTDCRRPPRSPVAARGTTVPLESVTRAPLRVNEQPAYAMLNGPPSPTARSREKACEVVGGALSSVKTAMRRRPPCVAPTASFHDTSVPIRSLSTD